MAKKKTVQSDEPATNGAPSPRRRTPPKQAAAASSGNGEPAYNETKPLAASPSGNGEPTYDEIAEAAYQRYLQRGEQHGQDFDDWVEAERTLKKRP